MTIHTGGASITGGVTVAGMQYAICNMLYAISNMPYVICYMSYFVCRMSFDRILLCHMPYAICHTLYMSFNPIYTFSHIHTSTHTLTRHTDAGVVISTGGLSIYGSGLIINDGGLTITNGLQLTGRCHMPICQYANMPICHCHRIT
jgi:hypothetical protein